MANSSSKWIFLHDKFVARDQALISVFDHGFLYGDGVFETLRAYGGKIFHVDAHLTRLKMSCECIGLSLPFSAARWRELLAETLHRNELSDASIRITISRGAGDIGLDPALCPHPTVVLMARPFRRHSPDLCERGVQVTLVKTRRNPRAAQAPEIKSLSYLNNILAKHEAIQAGCFDALMQNMEGFLTECTTSNVFFVHHAQLCTPAVECGILRGVTREVVMMLAKEDGMDVVEGSFSPEQLLAAEECFITNTGMEIMPVRQVGENMIGDACPGPITTRLQQLFQENLGRFLGEEENLLRLPERS